MLISNSSFARLSKWWRVRYCSRPMNFRMAAITIISPARPLKIAPTTKYGPKIVLCHMGAIATGEVPRDHGVHGNRHGQNNARHQLHGAFKRMPFGVAARPAER